MKKKTKKRFLRKYDGLKYGWFMLGRDFVLMLVGCFLLFNVFVGISRVSGSSMEPTLKPGKTVFFMRINGEYERADVVFARMPSGKNYVKRIVAVPGDVVDIRDGVLYVNDVAEDASGFLGPTEEQKGIVEYPYTVQEGMLFLVGDNRPVSEDSRSFGALPESSIRGKLILY